MTYEFMTAAVWERMKALLPQANSFGRPRCSDRNVLEGILWVLKTGARWRDIPRHLPSAATCLETLEGLGGAANLGRSVAGLHLPARPAGFGRLAGMLHGRQFCSGQKRGLCVGKTKKGKGTKWMVVADGQGLPVGGILASASPAEIRLAIPTLADCRERTGRFPRRLIVDRAYDADHLRELMRHLDGELICPHRRGRKRPSLQDGRALRRYRKRWKVERLFAWLGNWRRLLVCYERHINLYSGFFKLACVMILFKHF